MNLTYCSCDTEQSCNVKVQKVHPHSKDRQSHKPDGKRMSWVGGFFQSLISQAVYLTQIANNSPLLKSQYRMQPEVFEFLSVWCIINPIHVRQFWH